MGRILGLLLMILSIKLEIGFLEGIAVEMVRREFRLKRDLIRKMLFKMFPGWKSRGV